MVTGEKEKDPRIISSLQRALDMLLLFGSQRPELGIADIAKALNLHKSTASDLVYTLQRNGCFAQNPEYRRYHIAGYVLASLPLVIIFGFSSRRFMAGLWPELLSMQVFLVPTSACVCVACDDWLESGIVRQFFRIPYDSL
ncbi:MAG: helix-turn-helix domain-containing protein [Chloroflexi bacterium]|nr:helix-turn-helix domain-containing protein [Chloroflexota bacterium]